MWFRDVCNPVRVGAGLRACSGGGALLATGYFLAALQADALFWDLSSSFAAFPVCFGIAWRQGTHGDAFYSIITMSITTSVHHMSPRQGCGTVGRRVHGLAPRGYILPPRLGLNHRIAKGDILLFSLPVLVRRRVRGFPNCRKVFS